MLYYHHAVRDHSTLAISDDERAAYQWIETNTPRDAVFIEDDDIVRVPVLADRDDYWGTEAYARNWGYPAGEMSARRRTVRDHVFSAEGLSDADVARLKTLGRPVFVISEDGGAKSSSAQPFRRRADHDLFVKCWEFETDERSPVGSDRLAGVTE